MKREILIAAVVTIAALGLQWSVLASPNGLLEVANGARAAALGGAMNSIGEGVSGLFFNPASIPQVQFPIASSGYSMRQDLYEYFGVSMAFPFFAAGYHSLKLEDIPVTDEWNNLLGSTEYRSYAFICCAGVPVFKDADLGCANFGIRAKYFRVYPLEELNSGLNLDFGILFQAHPLLEESSLFSDFRVGFTAENLLNWAIQYGSGHQDEWRRVLVIGGSFEINEMVRFALDYRTDTGIAAGIELSASDQMKIRVGMPAGDGFAVSLGFGIQLGRLILDYAYQMREWLPDEHRVDLAFEFGRRDGDS